MTQNSLTNNPSDILALPCFSSGAIFFVCLLGWVVGFFWCGVFCLFVLGGECFWFFFRKRLFWFFLFCFKKIFWDFYTR